MAQQTINVGTSPNDGTGTPLRTAFQYTNSNFSELYTALGGGTGLPGATTQVIFNDGGTNLAGDAGLVYNKTTDALTIGGNVQAASATITGAATVGTTLGVTGVSTFAAGTALLPALTTTGDTNTGIYYPAADTFAVTTGGSERYRVDSSGNVGVGVAPSAWTSSYKALQIGTVGAISSGSSSAYGFTLSSNLYQGASGNQYITTGYAGRYDIRTDNGNHVWYTAASGSAGGVISLSTAMTLATSGNLLIGKTGENGTVGAGIIGQADGAIWSTMAASTSASNTLLVYSTGAAAYRFYVGLDGTVNATNATISAISDARFKENVQDIDVGLGAILALKPRKFDWKDGKGKNIKGDRGFIAQEFEQVFPQLVDEWKDNAPEGEAPYKSVRQDLIPVLVKAIQELAAEVNALKNA
jgi:hypothetical protein